MPPDEAATRMRLARLVQDGDRLRDQAAEPAARTASALRAAYLAWHSDVLALVASRFGDEPITDRYETTDWRALVAGTVPDGELAATVLGDLTVKLARIRDLLRLQTAVPPRIVPDRRSVGVAVYDANCLFSKHTRYVLLGLATYGVVQARWSRALLKETAGNLAGKLRGDSLEELGRWIRDDIGVVRGGLVEGYERWCDQFELPDRGDAHVLAAAIESRAERIVTANLRDFPAEVVSRFGIAVIHPDAFVTLCLDTNPVAVERLVSDHPAPVHLLDKLAGELPTAVAALHELGM